MSTLFPEPHPEFETLQIELLRSAPSCRKLEMVWQMNAAAGTLALSNLKARDPDDPPEKIRQRLAELLLGPDLAAKVCGPLGEVEDADSMRCAAPASSATSISRINALEVLDVQSVFW